MLTPSGRWEVNTPICLSGTVDFWLLLYFFSLSFLVLIASSHHQETWNPNWNLRTLVLSLRNFMTTQPQEIGSMNCDLDTQKRLAVASQFYRCPLCGTQHDHLLLDSFTDPDNKNIPTLHNSNLLTANDVIKTTTKKKKRSTAVQKKKIDKGIFQYFGGISLKSLFLASSFILFFLFQTGNIQPSRLPF